MRKCGGTIPLNAGHVEKGGSNFYSWTAFRRCFLFEIPVIQSRRLKGREDHDVQPAVLRASRRRVIGGDRVKFAVSGRRKVASGQTILRDQ